MSRDYRAYHCYADDMIRACHCYAERTLDTTRAYHCYEISYQRYAEGRYIRTLIHVLSLVIRVQFTFQSQTLVTILVRLVCTQPTTLFTNTVGLVLHL